MPTDGQPEPWAQDCVTVSLPGIRNLGASAAVWALRRCGSPSWTTADPPVGHG